MPTKTANVTEGGRMVLDLERQLKETNDALESLNNRNALLHSQVRELQEQVQTATRERDELQELNDENVLRLVNTTSRLNDLLRKARAALMEYAPFEVLDLKQAIRNELGD